ncbi:MAG: tRNA uridine-5-carboxymethylaminomethyl(34) synthesis GTPase MnmE [Rhodobacteraceae bacterium]|nr:tRNA uridine-5-carboxymethylaminomethyl(34) synthesis GTPase MnmE [Paracoccaceae bacterium]
MDTIYALATAKGRAGVAVIRVSGPLAHNVAESLSGTLPPIGQARLRKFHDANGDLLDEGLLICFGAGASFTGELVAEFQIHGSLAAIDAMMTAISAHEGVRLAEAGEFTQRAFRNERMDLSQVEGLAALIDAETEAQRKQAQRTLTGELGVKVEQWRRSLIEAAALIETTIDFAEEDVPEDVLPEAIAILRILRSDLDHERQGVGIAERLRDGFEVAIIGAPNTGKSTLINYLAKRDVAITSEIAGTTRDVIEVAMDLDGLPVTLIDTAGLRETSDPIEAQGVARGSKRADQADLKIVLKDSLIDQTVADPDGSTIELLAKDDDGEFDDRSISGVTGHGVSALLDALRSRLADRVSSMGVASTRRQEVALEAAVGHIDLAVAELEQGEEFLETAADHLRRSNHDLSALIGRVDVEDLLDHIFSSFCIGK